jgi:hypothetical protein
MRDGVAHQRKAAKHEQHSDETAADAEQHRGGEPALHELVSERSDEDLV